ncbi:MAG: hypothetical protein ACYYK0_01095 [Candidatus Eutrophobiaceae bacterium]
MIAISSLAILAQTAERHDKIACAVDARMGRSIGACFTAMAKV